MAQFSNIVGKAEAAKSLGEATPCLTAGEATIESVTCGHVIVQPTTASKRANISGVLLAKLVVEW